MPHSNELNENLKAGILGVLALTGIVVVGLLVQRGCTMEQELRLKRIDACKSAGGYVLNGLNDGTCIVPHPPNATPVPKQ
jgi:hypothetical protein